MDWPTIYEWVKQKFKLSGRWKVCVTAIALAAFVLVLLFTSVVQKAGEDLYEWVWHCFPKSPIECLISQIPPPPRPFVGRKDELAKLLKAVRKDKVPGCIITGMPGVGKTALALKLAEELAPSYPDARIFLDLKGTGERLPPHKVMQHVIISFCPDSKMPEDENQIAGLYRSILSGKKALLLFDNAGDAAQILPLIPPAGNLVIATSRQEFHIGGWFAIDLDVLPLDNSRELLLELCPRIGIHAEEIAQLCGRLPLALRLAGGALAARKDMNVEDYVRDLKVTGARLATLDRFKHLTDAEQKIEGSFDLSYRLLSGDLQRAWKMLSVFPSDFDSAGAADVWELAPDVAKERLGDLRTYSLVDWNEKTNRYGPHDLARDFAAARLAENAGEEDAARKRHTAHYLDVLRSADALYVEGRENMIKGLALFDLERGNIDVGFQWAARHLDSDSDAARMANGYADAGAYCLDLRQHPRNERIPWLEAALKAALTLKDKAAESAHLVNLGTAYKNLGDARKAIECCEKALVINREIANRRGEGADLCNLGLAYAALGDARKAIEYYEMALVIDREIGDRRGEGYALGSLGVAYADLGNARKAIEYHEKALGIMQELGDRRAEAGVLGNLGIAYKNLGDARKAIECHEKCLEIHKEIGDRLGEGRDLGNLGTAYSTLGDARKAIEYYERQLVIVRGIGDRRGEGNALGNLGVAYAELGDARKAIGYYEKRLAIAVEIGDRLGEGSALSNLGNAYAALDDARKAIGYYEKALGISREIQDRRAEGQDLGNLGSAFYSLGDARKAIEYYEKCLEIHKEIGDRLGEGTTLGNLGNAYSALGDARKAIEYYEKALVIDREIGDVRGESRDLWNLAHALYKLGRRDEAIRHAEASLKIMDTIESPFAPKVRAALEKWKAE